MYVDTLKIKNLRGFEQAEMRLNYPGRKYPRGVTPPRLQNVNLLLGENGSGKSTVFRALCIGVLRGYLNSSGFISDDNIRHGTDEAEITVGLQLNKWDLFFSELGGRNPRGAVLGDEDKAVTGTTTIYRQGNTEIIELRGRPKAWDRSLYFDPSAAVFLAAYGANRRTERPEAYNEGLRGHRYRHVATLFESHVGLVPFPQGIYQFRGTQQQQKIIDAINNTIPSSIRLGFRRIGDDERSIIGYEPRNSLRFDTGTTILKFDSLSDGYRSFIGWVLDLAANMTHSRPTNKTMYDLQGVVIVDEVDLLLHPAWQRTVVENLATTFPNLQFLFSTHSPIVAATLDAQNIFVTKNGKIEQFTESIAGKSIDAALTSPYFGLASPRSPELERNLGELAEKAMEGDFDASLQFLRLLRTGNDTAAKVGNGA